MKNKKINNYKKEKEIQILKIQNMNDIYKKDINQQLKILKLLMFIECNQCVKENHLKKDFKFQRELKFTCMVIKN